MSRSFRGARVAAAMTAGLALALAAPFAASAHVTLDTNTAEAGSYALLTLKVPNESATAATTRLTLTLPTDTPFTSVRTVPVAGWSAEIVRSTLPEPVKVGDSTITEAPTSIVWTATDGVGFGDGELGLFPVSLGPVPDTGSVLLPVAQEYSDGSVSDWAEPGEDAAKPAPVLYVNDAPASDHHGSASPTVDTQHGDHGGEHGDDAVSNSDDIVARVIGILGLIVGAVGVALAVTARKKTS